MPAREESTPRGVELPPPYYSPSYDEYTEAPKCFLRSHPKAIAQNVIDRLRELRESWDEAQLAINGQGDLKARLLKKQHDLAKKLISRQPMAGEQLATLSAVEADQEELKAFGIEIQRQISVEIFELASTFYPDLIAALDKWIIEKVQAEAEVYRQCGVRFDDSKSHLSAALRAAAARMRSVWQAVCVHGGAGDPNRLFPFLDLRVAEPKKLAKAKEI